MKIAATCVALAFGLAGAGALAQDAADAMEKLRACSLLARAERLGCLDKLSHDVSPPPRPAASSTSAVAAAADNWIVSETTSPLDYTPVAIATASSRAGPDGAMQLSIQCRGGRTDLVIGHPSLTLRAEDYVVSYAVNDSQPAVVAAGTAASGTGVALRGDVVRLLASLPDRGDIAFRVANRQGATLEGRYALAGLKTLLARLAVPCKWPAAAGAPRN
jgi:hypothetical protein